MFKKLYMFELNENICINKKNLSELSQQHIIKIHKKTAIIYLFEYAEKSLICLLLINYYSTVDENIIGVPKTRNDF